MDRFQVGDYVTCHSRLGNQNVRKIVEIRPLAPRPIGTRTLWSWEVIWFGAHELTAAELTETEEFEWALWRLDGNP